MILKYHPVTGKYRIVHTRPGSAIETLEYVIGASLNKILTILGPHSIYHELLKAGRKRSVKKLVVASRIRLNCLGTLNLILT